MDNESLLRQPRDGAAFALEPGTIFATDDPLTRRIAVSLNIYLTFDGNCREAFDFYRSVFGGDFQAFATFAEGPDDMGVAEEDRDNVMHVSLPVGDSVLMGSDNSPFGPPVAVGNNFSISIVGQSREHCDDVFSKLSASGSVILALQETFWGSYYGMWTDRFGINWMVNYPLPTD